MTRIEAQSDRDVSADTSRNVDSLESMARLLEQSEVAGLFDAVASARFGKMISAAALKPAKRPRRDRAA
jgi:hypothetical protein